MAVWVACTSSAALIRTRLYWSEMPYVGTVNNSDLLTVSGCGRSVAVVVSVPDWLYWLRSPSLSRCRPLYCLGVGEGLRLLICPFKAVLSSGAQVVRCYRFWLSVGLLVRLVRCLPLVKG